MPRALEKTWYTDNDYTLSDATSILTLSKSLYWAIKAILMRQILTTNCPAGAAWTMDTCCDSTQVKTDGTDLFTSSYDASKWVRAAAASPHSYFVLKSPTNINTTGASVYLAFDWSTASDHTMNIYYSKTRPTGGTTTARPTAADEVSWTTQQLYDSATPLPSKIHRTTDGVGNQILLWGKTGASIFMSGLAILTPTDIDASDTMPTVVYTDFSTSGNFMFNTNTSANWRASSSTSKGRNGANTATVAIPPIAYCPSNGSGQDIFSLMTSRGLNSGKFKDLPCHLFVNTASQYDIKGRLQDIWMAPGSLVQGAMFRQSSALTHMYVGTCWIPWNSAPTM